MFACVFVCVYFSLSLSLSLSLCMCSVLLAPGQIEKAEWSRVCLRVLIVVLLSLCWQRSALEDVAISLGHFAHETKRHIGSSDMATLPQQPHGKEREESGGGGKGGRAGVRGVEVTGAMSTRGTSTDWQDGAANRFGRPVLSWPVAEDFRKVLSF